MVVLQNIVLRQVYESEFGHVFRIPAKTPLTLTPEGQRNKNNTWKKTLRLLG